MTATIFDLAHQAATSPWVYLVIFAAAAIDAFFPSVPSESIVITAGVFAAASGEPNLFLVIVVAALGAFVGDHTSYLIGRTLGDRLLKRARPGTRRRAALDRAGRVLAERGGLILVAARYIPGGRTAATVTAGGVGYPLRSFSPFDGIAAVAWAGYSALIGYAGGVAFEDDPVKGVLLGLGLAVTITVLVETVRYLLRRSRSQHGVPDRARSAATRALHSPPR